MKQRTDRIPIILDYDHDADAGKKAGATVKIKGDKDLHPLQDHDSVEEWISEYNLVKMHILQSKRSRCCNNRVFGLLY